MHWTLRTGIFALGLLGISLSFADESRREHAAHEHGHGTGTLAEDAGSWQLSLELPGYNLVGFEHAPESESQERRLTEVLEMLESVRWLRPEPASNCRVDTRRAKAMGYGEPDDHEHRHDHESTETSHEHRHAAFRVSAVIICDSSRRMRWLELDLFDGFPENRSIRLDVLSESGAASYDLAPGDYRISFD